MTEQTTYKCPCCSAQLTYEPSGKFVCSACENEFDVETMNEIVGYNNRDAGFDWGNYKKEFEENAEKLECSVYVCASCGAQIETGETEVTAHCPYCGSEIVLSDKLSGGLRPNLIIPFKIDKKVAIEAVKKHFKDKKLLPDNFTKEYSLVKLQGIYVPFWLFEAGAEGTVVYDARTGGDEPKRFLIESEGKAQFSKVPVDASQRIDNDLMDALEPFDYNGLEAFTPAYLSGHLAERFDQSPDESLDRATQRIKKSVAELFRKDSYDQYRVEATVESYNLKIINPTVKYAILPIYLLNLEYKEKKYRFAVNGQTGKVVGELPIGGSKKVKSFIKGYLLTKLLLSIIIVIGIKVLFKLLGF